MGGNGVRVDGRGKGRGKWLKRELGQVVHGGQRGGKVVVKLWRFLFFILGSPDSWRESIKIGALIGNLFEGGWLSFCRQQL